MSQTLKFGNGTWATKKGSTLAYNDLDGNFKPLPFTYTGAGKGTRVNKEGLIEVVENDRPRIDYTDSEDGVFLLEKASTNLIEYSEDFSQSYWGKGNSSIVSNQIISPDGTLNADKLIESSSSGVHLLVNTSVSTDGSVTGSIYAKYLSRYLRLTLHDSTNPNEWYSVIYDLENGIIYDSLAKTVTVFDSKIEQMPNGYYRCVITADLGVNSSTVFYVQTSNGAAIVLGDDRGRGQYQGDGTSGVYIYGAMLEENSVASSYIPTQGTIQTRVAETASGSGNSEVFNSEGVLFANMSFNLEDSYPNLSIFNNTNATKTDNKIVIYKGATNSNQISVALRSGGSEYANITANVNVENYNKIVISYKSNEVKYYLNGFLIGTDNTVTVPIGLDTLNFDNGAGANDVYGKVKEIAYYDEILTDLELETLTSYRSWEAMVKELNLNVIYNG